MFILHYYWHNIIIGTSSGITTAILGEGQQQNKNELTVEQVAQCNNSSRVITALVTTVLVVIAG